jgi:hypothetical protein
LEEMEAKTKTIEAVEALERQAEPQRYIGGCVG